MIIKKIALLFTIILFFNSINAQEKVIPNNPNYKYKSDSTTTQTVVKHSTKPAFQRSWKFGGNIGLAFWNGGADILVAPKAYYQISPQFMAGFGLTYIYSKYNDQNFGYDSNSIGASVLGVFRPIHFLQLSMEFEELHTTTSWNGPYETDSYWNDALYLGVSFVTGNVAFGFQYNVLYDDLRSTYGSAFTPVISFYF